MKRALRRRRGRRGGGARAGRGRTRTHGSSRRSPAAGARLASRPAAVVVRLSEPAEPVGDAISVTGPDGQRRGARPGAGTRGDADAARSTRAAQGTYVVEWLVVGADSHPARGAFLFSVGEPTRSALPGPARRERRPPGARALALARSASHSGSASRSPRCSPGGMTRGSGGSSRPASCCMLVAEPVALLGQTASLAPSRMFEPDLARRTSCRRATATTPPSGSGPRSGSGRSPAALRHASPRAQWTIPAAGAAVAIVLRRARCTRLAGVPVACSAPCSSLDARRSPSEPGSAASSSPSPSTAGRRLARAAVLAVLALVLSGSALALAQLRRSSDLVETAYGTTLGVKLALVAADARPRRGGAAPGRARSRTRRAGGCEPARDARPAPR